MPTSLTSALKIDGVSWFDALSENGRRVFGFDLLGYGLSDDYPRDFVEKHDSPYYYGVGNSLTKEVDSVVDYICATTDSKKINIIAISRGAIPAGYYTNEFSHKVNSFIMHAPIVRKSQSGTDLLIKYFGERQLPNIAYFPMSIDDRYTLLRDDKPEGRHPLWRCGLSKIGDENTAIAFLATTSLPTGRLKLPWVLPWIWLTPGTTLISTNL